MDDRGQGSAAAVEFPSDANVTRSIVGLVKARDVHLTGSAAGFVAADGNFSILNGGAGPVLANGSVTIRNGGCGPLVANGDVSIENGGSQVVVASGGAHDRAARVRRGGGVAERHRRGRRTCPGELAARGGGRSRCGHRGGAALSLGPPQVGTSPREILGRRTRATTLTDVARAGRRARRRVRGGRAGARRRVRRHRRRGARPHPWRRNREGRRRDTPRRRHGVPHRVDDQELHGGDRVAPPRRGTAAAGRPCRVARPGAAGTTPARCRRAVDHDPSSPVDVRRVPGRRSLGRSAAGSRSRRLLRVPGGRAVVRVHARDGVRVLEPRVRDPRPRHHERHRDRSIATSFGRACWNRWA